MVCEKTIFRGAHDFDNAFRATNAIQDYVFTDDTAEKSAGPRSVQDLDTAQEVCVYAKLPRNFHILTPVDNFTRLGNRFLRGHSETYLLYRRGQGNQGDLTIKAY